MDLCISLLTLHKYWQFKSSILFCSVPAFYHLLHSVTFCVSLLSLVIILSRHLVSVNLKDVFGGNLGNRSGSTGLVLSLPTAGGEGGLVNSELEHSKNKSTEQKAITCAWERLEGERWFKLKNSVYKAGAWGTHDKKCVMELVGRTRDQGTGSTSKWPLYGK